MWMFDMIECLYNNWVDACKKEIHKRSADFNYKANNCISMIPKTNALFIWAIESTTIKILIYNFMRQYTLKYHQLLLCSKCRRYITYAIQC